MKNYDITSCLESDAFKLICKSFSDDSMEGFQKLINFGVGGEEIYSLAFGLMRATKMENENGGRLSDDLLKNDAFLIAVNNAVRINQSNPISAYMLATVDYAKANSKFVAEHKGIGELMDCIREKNLTIFECVELQSELGEALENSDYTKAVQLKNALNLKKSKQLNLDGLTQPYLDLENNFFNVALSFSLGVSDSRSVGAQVVNEGMNNWLMSSLGYAEVDETLVARLIESHAKTGNWKYKAIETLLCGGCYVNLFENDSREKLSCFADDIIAKGAERLGGYSMEE